MSQGNSEGKDKLKTKAVDAPQLGRRRSSQFLSVYANNATVTAGFFEVQLTFGQYAGLLPGETPYVEDSVSVAMTWEHTLKVRDLLNRILVVYQSEHGLIRLTKDQKKK